MSFYHVRITPKSDPSQTEVELDISLEELKERFVHRYEIGLPIVIAGRTVPSEDIGRIQVNETEQNSTSLNATIRQQQETRGSVMMVDHHGRLQSWLLADQGEDVTAKYITGPPGREAEVAAQTAEEHRPPANSRDVFVVHGRNHTARDALFSFLRAIKLSPLEWSEAVQATGKTSPYIGEILDAAFSRAHAVVVLFTPDDEARLRESFWTNDEPSHETELTGQARPNVLFEAGMAMAGSQDRTILVELGILRPFSDIAGRHTIRLDNSPQRRQDLAKRLQNAGCPVNLDGTDWYSTGEFEATVKQLVQVSSDSAPVVEQQSPMADPLQLSEEAKELLIEASKDRHRLIVVIRTNGGVAIMTNGKSFGKMGDTRLEAKWLAAIEELRTHQFVESYKGQGEAYEVTYKGFQVADEIGTSR